MFLNKVLLHLSQAVSDINNVNDVKQIKCYLGLHPLEIIDQSLLSAP